MVSDVNREQLHGAVDELPPSELAAALRYLRFLCCEASAEEAIDAQDIQGLDRNLQRRILNALERYAQTELGDVKRLQGRPGQYRLRVGGKRATVAQGLLRRVPTHRDAALLKTDLRDPRRVVAAQ
jgi:hypothetical protein